MKAGTKAFGMIGIIIYAACSLVVLWGCGGGGKVAKRGDAAAGQGEPAGGSFTDPRDNQTYRTVRIGNFTWMAENLNHQTENSWCYDDDPSNCDKYGRLYMWEAAESACSGLGGGWRLPSDEDWDDLMTAVGGVKRDRPDMGPGYVDWDGAGTKLKSKVGWDTDDGYVYGTDDFGFSALPGGVRDFEDSFFDSAGGYGSWWSATESDATHARSRHMGYVGDGVGKYYSYKTSALSVRCVMN